MNHEVDTVRLLVKACVILHNLMRARYPVMQNKLVDRERANGDVVPGAWRADRNLVDCEPQQLPGNNNALKKVKAQRNLLMERCSSDAGSVPWQERQAQLPLN